MNLWQWQLNSYFKASENSELLFFPYIYWGKGYKVTSQQDQDRISSHFKRLSLMVFFFVVLTNIARSILPDNWDQEIMIALFVAVILTRSISLTLATKHLTPSVERLRFHEVAIAHAKTSSLTYLIGWAALCLALTGFFTQQLNSKPDFFWLGIVATIITTISSSQFIYRAYLRLRYFV